MEHIIEMVDYIAFTTMSVEEWFDIYGVAILKREEAKRTGLKAMGKAAGR
jgi:hypothetical protein